jgi:hypothetical protein
MSKQFPVALVGVALATALVACSSSGGGASPAPDDGDGTGGVEATGGRAGKGGSGPAKGGNPGTADSGAPPAGDDASAPVDMAAADAPGGSATGGSGGSPGEGGAGGAPMGDGGAPGTAPLLALLGQFTAADVPARGPMESPPTPRSWTAPATLPMQPGMGLAQHPMLYAGEGFNTIFLVNEGKVIWSYASPPGGEIDDVWMLSNAHILYAHSNFLEELTPKKEVVWHYDMPPGTESHSLQPIGLDKVLFARNGQPAHIILMNKATKTAEVDHVLMDAGATTHPQFRRIRMTAAGTYVAPYLSQRKVVEFDKDFKVIWDYAVADMGTPWTALRLANGNTLIQDEHNKAAREVNPMSQIVWEFKSTDLPAGIMRGAPQTSERLANGNTVMMSPGKNVGNAQVVEVNMAKQVVWVLQDWKDLGPATTAQFLDQPGIPEKPGDLIH